MSRDEPSGLSGWESSDGLSEDGSEVARKIVDTVCESMVVLDESLHVVSANESFYKTFQVSREEIQGRLVYELGNGQWDTPELRRLLDEVLPENNVFNDFEIDFRIESIGRRVMLLNGRRIDHIQLVLLAIEDITDSRMAERRRSFLLGLSDAFLAADDPQEILDQSAIRLCQFLHCQRTVYLAVDVPRGLVKVLAQYPEGQDGEQLAVQISDFSPDLLAALTRGDDLVIDDVRKDSRLSDSADRASFEKLGVQALACIARRRENGRLGLTAVGSADVHRWRAEELDLLRDVADRTWAALDVALATTEIERLNESLERQVSLRTETLRLLQDVTRSANEAQTVEEAMQAALERVADFNGWALGHVWRLADDDSGQMVSSGIWFTAANTPDDVRRLREFQQTCSRHRYSWGEGLIGAVRESGEPKSIDEIADLEAWRRDNADRLGLHSVVAFPVTVNGDVAAVMEFFSWHVPRRDTRFMEITPDIGIQLGHVIERKRLEKGISDATEAEQRRIGRDIHDGVGQELSGLRYMAQTHAESLAQQASPDARTAQRMTESLEKVQQQLRGIIRQLVPLEIDTKGLVGALRGLAERVSETHDLICEFECHEPIFIPDAALGTHLYRIVQEAVRNAIKHARASRVTIRLTEDKGKLRLLVSDDGVGLSKTNSHTGIGLRSMTYRARLIGATLDIRTRNQAGTLITCTILRGRGGGEVADSGD